MAAWFQAGSSSASRICEVCTQNAADFFCECAGVKQYFCEGCFPTHVRKNPDFQHNLVRADIEASNLAAIQARTAAFAAGRAELLQNLNVIDQCCYELESTAQMLHRYLQEQISQLQTLKATLTADIEESVREVESTLTAQEVKLRGKYSIPLRNYESYSLVLFSYQLDQNLFNTCRSSLLAFTLKEPQLVLNRAVERSESSVANQQLSTGNFRYEEKVILRPVEQPKTTARVKMSQALNEVVCQHCNIAKKIDEFYTDVRCNKLCTICKNCMYSAGVQRQRRCPRCLRTLIDGEVEIITVYWMSAHEA